MIYANIQPISDPVSGKQSQFSLGVIKHGVDISPAFCQNININNKANISILLSEEGCLIS